MTFDERQSAFSWFNEVEQVQVSKQKPKRKFLYMVHIIDNDAVYMANTDGDFALLEFPAGSDFFMKKGQARDMAYSINHRNGAYELAQTVRYNETHVNRHLRDEDAEYEVVQWTERFAHPND